MKWRTQVAKRSTTKRRKAEPVSRFDTRSGRLYKRGRLLCVSPLLVALCLFQAGLPLSPARQAVPAPVGNRIVRLATFLDARLALNESRKVTSLGGSDERA